MCSSCSNARYWLALWLIHQLVIANNHYKQAHVNLLIKMVCAAKVIIPSVADETMVIIFKYGVDAQINGSTRFE
ncbi:MAG: hypothetical protein JW745_09755 [Sedimentisphaerales bacterium]|nr:hypothetical protein [Sedimentisphaerales bacterium]MBN2842679.1 hypothetical protein [Sedimentisphaerales bacterium]